MIKISIRMKKNFICFFSKNENDFLKILIFGTHCLVTIWVFQISELSDQYYRRYDIFKNSYLFGIALCCIVSTQKNIFFNRMILFLIKTAHFTQKWNFFIQVDILISCLSLSRLLLNSTQKHRKIRHFSQCIWFMIHNLHFFDFDMSSQN